MPFSQHQDTELWNNQFPETKILGLPVSRRMRGLVYMASRDKADVDTFHKGIQYALEKLGKSKFGFERTTVSNFKSKRHEGSGDELVDYSRAPCLGTDQKARGLWERDWRQKMRATVCSSIEHARARDAPHDAFYVNFICQLIFRRKCFGAKESNCCWECFVQRAHQSLSRENKFIFRPQTRYIQYFDEGLNRSFVRAFGEIYDKIVGRLGVVQFGLRSFS